MNTLNVHLIKFSIFVVYVPIAPIEPDRHQTLYIWIHIDGFINGVHSRYQHTAILLKYSTSKHRFSFAKEICQYSSRYLREKIVWRDNE